MKHCRCYLQLEVTNSSNLEVEKEVAKLLGSSHIPLHILSRSRTCKKMEEACLKALVDVESTIKFADLVTAQQPQLKSFIRQTRSVALTMVSTSFEKADSRTLSTFKDIFCFLQDIGRTNYVTM